MASIYPLNWPVSWWIHFTISTYVNCELRICHWFTSLSHSIHLATTCHLHRHFRNDFAWLNLFLCYRNHKCAWKSTFAEQRAIDSVLFVCGCVCVANTKNRVLILGSRYSLDRTESIWNILFFFGLNVQASERAYKKELKWILLSICKVVR